MRGLTITLCTSVIVLIGCDGIGIVLTSGDAIVDYSFEPPYDPPYDPPYEPPYDPP